MVAKCNACGKEPVSEKGVKRRLATCRGKPYFRAIVKRGQKVLELTAQFEEELERDDPTLSEEEFDKVVVAKVREALDITDPSALPRPPRATSLPVASRLTPLISGADAGFFDDLDSLRSCGLKSCADCLEIPGFDGGTIYVQKYSALQQERVRGRESTFPPRFPLPHNPGAPRRALLRRKPTGLCRIAHIWCVGCRKSLLKKADRSNEAVVHMLSATVIDASGAP
jgi:hypothetical protein